MSRRIIFKVTVTICLASTTLSPLSARNFGQVLNGLGGEVEKVFNDGDDNNDHNRDRTAAKVGCAAGGGVAGAIFGKSDLGKVIIGVAVAAICWNLALRGKDNERLTAKSNELLNRDGATSENWYAPESKQNVRISTGQAHERNAEVPFAFDENVAKPAAGTVVEAKNYVVVTNRLNFRSAPRTGNNLIGYFDKGETVEVIGRSADGKWALVGDRGVVVGYAAFRDDGQDLLVTPEQARARRATVKSTARARPKVVKQAGGDLSAAKPRTQTAKPKTAIVRASTECKAVTAQSGGKSDTRTGCALPNGQWAIA